MNRQPLISFIQSHLPAPSTMAHDIAFRFEEKHLVKGEFLLLEGKISNEYFFLEEGMMRAYATDPDGNEVTTGFHSKNNVVFEVSSFFNQTLSKENIQALTDCKGYIITFQQLNQLFHSLPEFREFGRAILVKGFIALKERTLSLITETAEERYNHLITTKGDLFQHVALKHIASYLGITDTSLSRIRRESISK